MHEVVELQQNYLQQTVVFTSAKFRLINFHNNLRSTRGFRIIYDQGGENAVNSHFGCLLLTANYLLLTAKI